MISTYFYTANGFLYSYNASFHVEKSHVRCLTLIKNAFFNPSRDAVRYLEISGL